MELYNEYIKHHTTLISRESWTLAISIIMFLVWSVVSLTQNYFEKISEDEKIASIQVDQNLEYKHDSKRDEEVIWHSVQHAQQKKDFNHDECNHKYTLPEPKEFYAFSFNIYNNYENNGENNIPIEEQWRLLYRVQGKVIYKLFDGFFAELYFNTENHFLLLVIKGTNLNSIGDWWSDIKNVWWGSKDGIINSAFTFGEKVRVLMNEFKCKPMLLITGHSLGGYLAQIITYTITYCFVDENEKVMSRKEPMDDFGIYTVVFDSPAALKQISSIAQRDPIQPERFRLPIVNFIKDVNIINSTSIIGPHLGLVISVKEFEELNSPNWLQRIVKVLPTHTMKNFEEIDLTQCRQVEYLPWKKTDKYEEKEIQDCFFSSKNFERLQKYLFFFKMCAELVDRLPNFQIFNSCIFLQGESSSAGEFIPKAHFFLSQFREKLDNGTFDGKKLIDNTIYEIWKAEMQKHAHNFCLNEQWKGRVQAFPDGTKIGGFKSFEEMRFAGCLIHNSFQRCIYFDFDQFNSMNREVLENLTLTAEAMLILIVRGNNENIIHQGGNKLKILYLVLDEDTEVTLTLNLTNLEEKSKNHLNNTELDFMGNKVSALEIFGIELLEKLPIWEIYNFQKKAVLTTPDHFYSNQTISGESPKKFNSAIAFARELINIKTRFVLISSDAGMGKSTALRQIALTLQQELPNNWIVHINLFDIQTQLSRLKDTLTSKESAVEFARNMELKDRMSEEVLIKVFNWKLQKMKIVFLFDSLDEVCPLYRDTVVKFIELLRETQLKIVMTTRPHEGKNFPNAVLFKLEPLDKEQRRDFIDQKFKMLGKNPPSDIFQWLDNIKSYQATEKCLKAGFFIITFCDKVGFWSLPLNLNMAASIYDADAVIANSSGFILNENIYEVFLTKSIEDTMKIKLKINKEEATSYDTYIGYVELFNELVDNLAVCLIFHGGDIDKLEFQETKEKIRNQGKFINRFDVAKLDNEYKFVSFLHRSYAEHLVAKLFIQFHQTDFNGQALKLNNEQLKRIYLEDEFSDVRTHVCQILASSDPPATMNFVPDFINGNENDLLAILVKSDSYELYLQLKTLNFKFDFEKCNNILYLALEKKARKEFMQQLIKDGAKFEDILNKDGVLHLAIMNDLIQEVKDHFESLKVNINVEHNNNFPLHLAAEHACKDLVEFLIVNGADVDAKNENNETALFLAIFANNAEICELLIAKGADCTQALNYAAIFASKELFDMIYKNTPSELRVKRVRKAHFEALTHGNLDIFKHICGLPEANPLANNSFGDSFLHHAAAFGRLHCMPFILEYMKQSIDFGNSRRQTSLMTAFYHNHEEVVEWLLKQHADIHVVDKRGTSCLHRAAAGGNIRGVQMCLDAEIDVNSQDKNCWTALYFASEHSKKDVVKYLLEKGADPEIKDTLFGNTCLHAACEGDSLECVKMLVELLPLNSTNRNGKTPLHVAALEGNKEIVAFLLEEAKKQNLEPVDSETIIRLTKELIKLSSPPKCIMLC